MTGLTKIYLAIAFLITGFLVGDAYGMTAGEWATKYKKPASAQEVAILLAYVKGASEGVEWMDTEMQSEHKVNIFCIPERLALTLEQRVSMFKKVLNDRPFLSKFRIGAVMIEAYKYAFPCINNQP
jgi:hypothetical protein